MKRLNFRHFNTNSKKFTITANFIQKETKTAPKGQYYFVYYIKKFSVIFRRFPIISEDFRRLPKILKDCRRCPKEKIFGYIFVVIFTCERFFSVREILVIYSSLLLLFFLRKTLQTLNSIFSGNSKHYKIGQFNSKH